MKRYAAVLSVIFCLAPSLWAAHFVIDPVHSGVAFKVKHMTVSRVEGQFDKFSGAFDFDPADAKVWKASAAIEAASINTRNENRDKHLRSADFFDAAKYPLLTFESTGVSDVTKEGAKVSGILTLRGISKPVVLNLQIGGTAQDPWGNTRAGFEATARVNRKDFGMIWNKVLGSGGLLVGEDVDIDLHVEGVQQK